MWAQSFGLRFNCLPAVPKERAGSIDWPALIGQHWLASIYQPALVSHIYPNSVLYSIHRINQEGSKRKCGLRFKCTLNMLKTWQRIRLPILRSVSGSKLPPDQSLSSMWPYSSRQALWHKPHMLTWTRRQLLRWHYNTDPPPWIGIKKGAGRLLFQYL